MYVCIVDIEYTGGLQYSNNYSYHLSDTETMAEVVEWVALVAVSHTCLYG